MRNETCPRCLGRFRDEGLCTMCTDDVAFENDSGVSIGWPLPGLHDWRVVVSMGLGLVGQGVAPMTDDEDD